MPATAPEAALKPEAEPQERFRAGGRRLLRLRADAPERGRPRILGEALMIAWLAWIYDLLSNYAPLRAHEAIANAWGIWHAERALGIDPELILNRWLSAHHTLGQIASFYYDNAHFIVTFGLLGYLYLRRAELYRPLRSALALVNVIGFAVFWLYPLAPPRMLSAPGFYDIVGHSDTFGQWHTGALAHVADQFAAMPSLHVAWALWCAVAIWRSWRRPLGRCLAVLYPALTTLVILATGNHFVLDGLGGVGALALAFALEKAPAALSPIGSRLSLRRAHAPGAMGAVFTRPAGRAHDGPWATIARPKERLLGSASSRDESTDDRT
ncbi:MAG TPA: phosphatase PAP2 family protein [Solirubrobacteraceae bacterium]|nr:phosphatase PAP2 family protein [Solirubrobacteraceae bacterium]